MPLQRPTRFALSTAVVLALFACGVDSTEVRAQEATPTLPTTPRDAVARSLALLERAARNYPRHRDCFACHHQSFPLLVQVEGRRIGLRPDEPTRQAISRFTRDWFSQRQPELRAGQSIDGRAITVAYGLWTLEMAEVDDPVTDAMVDYLLKVQRADGAWEPEALRPPAEESKAFVTALALRGLHRASRRKPGQAPPIHPASPQAVDRDASLARAAERAFDWLTANAAAAIQHASIDDQAGQLLSYVWRADRFPGDKAPLRSARMQAWTDRLASLQGDNGGWAQRAGMESDPYATGLALWTLAESGFDVRSQPFRRGAEYLRARQAADGSWHTRSRCEPFQPFFDNGDPYGRDQFLSLMATGWAAAALARFEDRRDD